MDAETVSESNARRELARLRAENERLREEVALHDRFQKFVIGEGAWERFCDLEKDAERHRWVRMNRLWLKANLPMIAAPEFDAAIDAAMGGES